MTMQIPNKAGLEPANWALWSQMPTAEVWQAVLLSMNLMPTPESGELIFRKNKNSPDPLYFEANRRLKVSNTHIEAGSGPAILAGTKHTDTLLIDLAEFGSFAKRLGWSLCQEYPVQTITKIDEPDSPQPPIEKPANPKERENLLRIIGVLCELAGHDLRRATSGLDIARALEGELTERNVRLRTQSVAEKISSAQQLIRAAGPGTWEQRQKAAIDFKLNSI